MEDKKKMTAEELEELQAKWQKFEEAERIFKETGRIVIVDPFKIISEIKVNNKTLILVHNEKRCWSAVGSKKNDEILYEDILNNPEWYARNYIMKNGENEYLLQLASTENFGYFHSWKGMESLLKRLLIMYNPIIRTFISWAQTGVLDKEMASE